MTDRKSSHRYEFLYTSAVFWFLATLSLPPAISNAGPDGEAGASDIDGKVTFEGTAIPFEFRVYDSRTQRFERGFGFPAMLPGKLVFGDSRLAADWNNATSVLHFHRGAEIASIADVDLDSDLAAERGRLAPLWSEFFAMRNAMEHLPSSVSSFQLLLKEGAALSREAAIREREMERDVLRKVVSPADAEIIEGSRHSVNIHPGKTDLFRYYPLSHVRFHVRIPLAAWGSDTPMQLEVNKKGVQILKVFSADLDETNEEWILGIEFKPSESFKSMNESFQYRLTINPALRPVFAAGLKFHPPSCAIVGRRRTYKLSAPKVAGLVSFTTPENAWVELGDQVGGVKLEGLNDLLEKISDYRGRAGRFIHEVEGDLIPAGTVADHESKLIELRQYHAGTGRLLKKVDAMGIEAKGRGLLVGTLDYQGPLSAGNSEFAAHIKSEYVVASNVLLPNSIDVQDNDIVLVELPSGGQRLAKVFEVVAESVGAIQDLQDVQRISVLIHSPNFLLGEAGRIHSGDNIAFASGMPVNIYVPDYANASERQRIQGQLRAEFELAQKQPSSLGQRYPIQFTFQSSSLTPLEKMAHMQRSHGNPNRSRKAEPSYVALLAEAIIREQNPELRWQAFRRMAEAKYSSGFESFIEIAVRGSENVSNAALFHLYEKRRPFELLEILQRLRQRNDQKRGLVDPTQPRSIVCYQLLAGMLAYPNAHSDALTHFVKRGRLDAVFRKQLDELFEQIIDNEGGNSPASLRILRGHGPTGQPFLTETELEMAAARTGAKQQGAKKTVYQRELARRILLGISQYSRFGYGATFIENGFMYLRDLEKIDALIGSRQNYLHDIRFLESSPNWQSSFPLDPAIMSAFDAVSESPLATGMSASSVTNSQVEFSDIELATYRQMTKTERSRWIHALGTRGDFIALLLLLRDPIVRHNSAGDILDFLLLTPATRLELARFYSMCGDSDLLDLIDERQFAVEVLADMDAVIRSLEKSVLQTQKHRSERTARTPGISPATIHVYQALLVKLAARSADGSAELQHYLVSWFGLLPSAFELRIDSPSSIHAWSESHFSTAELESASNHVRQRRALKHAVTRERNKRAENTGVEVRPGTEETVLRRVLEQVEAGMPVTDSPATMLESAVENFVASNNRTEESVLALKDTLRLVRLRDQEFASGQREHLRFQDIAWYTAWIVFSPLYLLVLIPCVWGIKGLMVLLSGIRVGSLGLPQSQSRSMHQARQLLSAIDDGDPLKRELSRWVNALESDSMNLERVARLQESTKRIMNSTALVYRVADSKASTKSGGTDERASSGPDSLHPDKTAKLAPSLSLLALLSRMTAEQIVVQSDSRPKNWKRTYLLMEWFSHRSTYFSGYRYTLDSLANYQIAEAYIWQSLPPIDVVGFSPAKRVVCLPINLFIGLVNIVGRIFLSLPMRFLYLFVPISVAGAALFQASLRRLVIRPGNFLEEDLYPDPKQIMQKTKERVRTGWAGRETVPDQPGGRSLFVFRRIATRVLPFMIIATVVCGGFPNAYAILTQGNLEAAWNIRSTGVYAVFAAIFILALTMVLHWLPLLTGWIPFNHWHNQVMLRRLRRHARRKLLLPGQEGLCPDLPADDELRRLYIDDAMVVLRSEREAERPLLDLIVLMVEVPELLERYRRIAASLVNKRTTVLAFVTDKCMDGGGARLDTLKRIQEAYPEIRKRNLGLPEHFEETRSYFMPIGKDCNPLAALPFNVVPPTSRIAERAAPLTSFVLAIANVQAFMRNSFVDQKGGSSERFVGSITATPQRMYVGPHNVDQGGRFRGGITLVGAFESIRSAVRQGSMVLMGDRAFIRSSTSQLQSIIRNDATLGQWLDPTNESKRQLPVGQIVIERFRTADRYRRHISTCVRYIDEIRAIRNSLMEQGRQNDRDVTDREFTDSIAIHYMRHLIVPWFIAFQGGSLEGYCNAVLTNNLGVRDRRRIFNQRVLELIELFQEEGQLTRRQLPKVRFVTVPTARIFYAKTTADINHLHKLPQILFPKMSRANERLAKLETV